MLLGHHDEIKEELNKYIKDRFVGTSDQVIEAIQIASRDIKKREDLIKIGALVHIALMMVEEEYQQAKLRLISDEETVRRPT